MKKTSFRNATGKKIARDFFFPNSPFKILPTLFLFVGVLVSVISARAQVPGLPPRIVKQPASQFAEVGDTVTFTATPAASLTRLSFQWQQYGVNLRDATNITLVLTNVQLRAGGDYTLVVANSSGQVTSVPASLTVASVSNASVSLGANTQLRVQIRPVQATTYQWSHNAVPVPGATNSSLSFTNVVLADAGDYSVEFTVANGAFTPKPVTLEVDPTFTKITAGAIVTDSLTSDGAIWVDYDNDGWLDLFVGNGNPGGGFRSNLYHNNHDGTFTRITAGPLVTELQNASGGAWADFDNDGLTDVFVAQLESYRANLLYRNLGGGDFTLLSNTAGVADTANSWGAAWADYDNDGWLDLVVANAGRGNSLGGFTNFFYHNRGDGTFAKITQGNIATDKRPFLNPTWVDYDNDGLIDLLVTTANQKVSLYRNLGGGNFETVEAGALTSDVGNSYNASWGDYDNDGFLDVFMVNGGDNAKVCALYHNSGDGTFTRVTEGQMVTEKADWRACIWGDYDNDGFLDLYVVSANAGHRLYHNEGNGTFRRIASGSPAHDVTFATCAAWGDYDNNGFLDLFVGAVGGKGLLYQNNSNSNQWIKFKLEGRFSNRSAVGAKVRVSATIGGRAMTQLRETAAREGFGSPSTPYAEFGLGNATNIDTVRIEWPSGIVQELYNVASKQFLTVTESVLLAGPQKQDFVGGADFTFGLVTNLTGLTNYQWRLNGNDLPGETNTTLTVRNAGAANAGKYTIAVTLPNGDLVQSSPAILAAPVPPGFDLQPVDVTVNPGESARFIVAASGSPPLTYQWSVDGAAIAGATNATLTIAAVQPPNVGDYTVVVRNAGGAATSTKAALALVGGAQIGTPPKDLSVSLGADARFAVQVSGSAPFTYQWRSNGVDIVNATKRIFVLTNATLADDGTKFSVVVRNDRGSANSTEATLHVDGTFSVYPSSAGIVSTHGNGVWGDYDGDGFLDLFLARFSNPNLLFHNNGDGTFSSVTNATTANNLGARSQGAVWGDYDNDGKLDLLVANGSGNANNTDVAHLFHNDGNGVFHRVFSGPLGRATGDFNSVAWADADNDGYLDALLTAFAPGRNYLFRNAEATNFVSINNPVTADRGSIAAPAFADYDNDGFVDLFIDNFAGPKNFLYHNNGQGSFIKVVGNLIADQPAGGGSPVGAWGDYDNDGLPDLYVPNDGTRNFLYHNDGNGKFTIVSQPPIATDTDVVNDAVWGDYDNDGFLDLFVVGDGRASWMYHNNGDGTFSRADVGSPVSDVDSWFSCSFADFDNDGFLDLYLAGNGRNKFYRNNGNTNNWAKFSLVGTASNRASIGAKVRVSAKIHGRALTQLREISTYDGWTGNGLRAEFGLGDATNMDKVRIEWPSGIAQEWRDLAAKQFLSITEPDVTVSPKRIELIPGTNETFTVVMGAPGTFTYQWRFNGTNLVGKTNATLVLNNAQPNQAGAYSVILSNAEVFVQSAPGLLTFTSPPVFTPDAVDQSASLGADVQFLATVIGTPPLFYQWYSNEVALTLATNATLIVPNVQMADAGSTFRVVVTNQYGSATSRTLTLTIDPAFTKITRGPVVSDSGNSRAGAWADYNNDGFLDLYVVQRGVQPSMLLYVNNGDGTFSKLATNVLGTDFGANADALSGSWGDYDNDGFLDLFVTNGSGVRGQTNAFLYHNRGDGTFELMTTNNAGDIAASPYLFAGGSWADYDNDGFLDLIARAAEKDAAVLYHNNGDGTFSRVTGGDITLDPDPTFRQATVGTAWADYDNDGRADFFATNPGINPTRSSDYLYHNNGDGTFTKVTQGPEVSEASPTFGCAWGDYDNDGFPDLYVTTWSGQGGTNFLYHNERDGTFTRITNGVFGSEGGNSRTAAWGDYDNDGYLDLFVANAGLTPLASGGSALVRKNSFLYHNNGDGTFTKILTGSLVNDSGSSFSAAWGDYNNDGFLDLFVGNAGPAGNENDFLYRNNGNSNHWLVVKCVGTASNRLGLGAKVRVTAAIHGGVMTQSRELFGNEGISGTPPALAHFGLADATNAAIVRIEWPSGLVQELHDVAVNQFLIVTERVRPQIKTPVRLANGVFQFTLVGRTNDVYRVESSPDLKTWQTLSTVTNTAGTTPFTDTSAPTAERRYYRAVLQ